MRRRTFTQIIVSGLVLFLLGTGMVAVPGIAQAAGDRSVYDCGINWRQFAGERLDILFYHHPWQEVITPFIPEFEKLTGIKANMVRVPHDEAKVKIPADFTAGTFAFDLFMGRYMDAPKFQLEGWTTPLEEFLNDPQLTDADWYDFNDFFPSAQDITTIGGYMDRLPITAEASITIFRKDVYAQAGLVIPTTFDELLDAARTISETTKMYGITLRGGSGLWLPLYGLMRSYGGDWWTPDGKIHINTPESVAGVAMLAELAKYAPPGVATYGWDQINTAMMSGIAATFIDSSVVYPRLQDPKRSTVVGKVGAAPYPKGPAGRVATAHYWSICMSNLSKKKGAGWLFLQWSTSKPMQKKIALGGILPPRASIWTDPEFGAAYTPDFINAMNVTAKTAVILPVGVHLWGLVDMLERKVQEVILGKKDAKPAMDELAVEWKKFLQ